MLAWSWIQLSLACEQAPMWGSANSEPIARFASLADFFAHPIKRACSLACIASVSVWFRSKEIPRKRTFGFDRARNETRAKKWKRVEGEGKEGNACRQTPRFWKPAFASERSAWLARLVEQCWHVSIKGLFHTERSCLVRDTHINFLWLLFILVGKIFPPMQEHFI